jgi:hypothetical protein
MFAYLKGIVFIVSTQSLDLSEKHLPLADMPVGLDLTITSAKAIDWGEGGTLGLAGRRGGGIVAV